MFQCLLTTVLISHDTNGLLIGNVGGGKDCLAGQACGGTLLGKSYGGEDTPMAHGVKGYILYGTGQFDGQSSGHEFYGTVFTPSIGFVNNCDGGRSHNYCDYRQQ
uniref:Uncharacterized protein n=1 Tax=Hemiselmis andersenii TaxID=464988 RepID=A0A6U2HPB7_HEMAN|mmetsp:Transcript_4122/g.9379  ORF Transcript_4122/g.9379 Transcript_4122/m.9379 type:complete len:105 (+) Transcript_4122:40-354(+)|eukprot:CAMPEP_0169451136 /NCGR_PEP_ID=MMETSP1042-20121227/13535_1 /TAXON_ID=464988 /ORGANISM="Hemiselmis andersenii, Strain CCMP1180" /LENGTH=104 /DNA_ID=CAMNT_0009563025 /DNA_START=58 /DNA_END=372 /DNA_ORIENTATION=+